MLFTLLMALADPSNVSGAAQADIDRTVTEKIAKRIECKRKLQYAASDDGDGTLFGDAPLFRLPAQGGPNIGGR